MLRWQVFSVPLTLYLSPMFRRPVVYIQVMPGSATGSVVGAPRVVTEASLALSHPRTLMGEFGEVERCLRALLDKLGLCRWFARAPIALVHLVPEAHGGYTNVELRAFREAMVGAGAAQVFLLADHPPLTPLQQAEFMTFFAKSLL